MLSKYGRGGLRSYPNQSSSFSITIGLFIQSIRQFAMV